MTTTKAVATVCGIVGAFGLGWVISDQFTQLKVELGLRQMEKDGLLQFGQTINGVFHRLSEEETCKILDEKNGK